MIAHAPPAPLSVALTAWCALLALGCLSRCDVASVEAQETYANDATVGDGRDRGSGSGRQSPMARVDLPSRVGNSAGSSTVEPSARERAEARGEPTDLHLLLAKAFVSEADLDNPIDHAAIAHALQRRAVQRGVTLDQQIRDYVSALTPTHVPTPRTRWVLELDATGTRPPSFPAKLDWDTCRGKRCTPRRELWLAAIKRAEAFLRGELADPCGASNWGARNIAIDVRRAKRAIQDGRWLTARCAGARTANAFYTTRAR